MALKVSEVARLAGVSVRTLHHYDEIGLVRPSARSEAGYRLYAPADVERLQQVLFFRELDFALEEIQRILADPDFDVGSALRLQRRLLGEKALRIEALVAAVDAAINALEKGTTMTPEERLQVFGDFDPEKYEAEAEQRWGGTEAFKESARRTKSYRKEDWEKIKAEAGEIYGELARLVAAGASPTSAEAMDVAERHRAHITRWFYTCSLEIHRGLGQLYVDDPRFLASVDKFGSGVAAFARDAFRANAERQGK
jgi:MerR family transcriptional regulator, thiopeptide resistance regulator